MGVHVAHFVRGNSRIAEGHLDSKAHTFAVFAGGRHVVGIGTHANTSNAGQNVGAALLRVT